MEGYPLHVSVPYAELAKSTLLRLRHTTYCIEIDDCGKTYKRFRRFNNFAWLHGELRRRQLACVLPELPPKRKLGNLEPGFVERRRQMLEEYLHALLRLPAVIQDDTLWAFLDADFATIVVPRFLCRSPSCTSTARSLVQLERIAALDADIFRLCSPTVLAELANYARGEARGALEGLPAASGAPAALAVPATGAGAAVDFAATLEQQNQLRARMAGRLSFCAVLQMLLARSHTRHALIQAGMFGALLTLLSRVTEEQVAEPQLPSGLWSSVHGAVILCLRRLVEESRGAALLQFCQQEDGLAALRRLASPESTSLHPIAVSLLWHGLQSEGVVDALVGASAKGLTVLGRLLSSTDVSSRTLAALSVGWVLRQDSTLDAEQRQSCLNALRPVPADLDAASDDRVHRAAIAEVGIDAGGNLVLGHAREVQPPVFTPWQLRNGDALEGLLRALSTSEELARLRILIEASELDEVTAAGVAVLDMCALYGADDPEWLEALEPVAPVLRRLAAAPASCSTSSAAPVEDIRVRAARVLIRLSHASSRAPGGRSAPGEPPSLMDFEQRVEVLEVLAQYLEACQADAVAKMDAAGLCDKELNEHVETCDLMGALAPDEVRLDGFAAEVSALQNRRERLKISREQSGQALEGFSDVLEQKREHHDRLCADVEELRQTACSHFDVEERHEEALEALRAAEEHCRNCRAAVEHGTREAEEAEALCREGEAKSTEAESRVAALAQEQAELAEHLRTAPEQAESVRLRLLESEERRGELKETWHQLVAQAEQSESNAAKLRQQSDFSELAIQRIDALAVEVESLKGTKKAELTEQELAALLELELQAQAKPSRLGTFSEQSAGEEVPEDAASSDANAGWQHGLPGNDPDLGLALCDGEPPPVWDDATAARSFRAAPSALTLMRLLQDRRKLWVAEMQWLSTACQDLDVRHRSLLREQLACASEEQAIIELEARLREEVRGLEDFNGHRSRQVDVAAAMTDAQEEAWRLRTHYDEDQGAWRLAEASLEIGRERARAAEEANAEARAIAEAEAARCQEARQGVQDQTVDLEQRTRSAVEEWLAVDLQERQLHLRQSRVAGCLRSEFEQRGKLRADVQSLISELQDLDQRLNVAGVG